MNRYGANVSPCRTPATMSKKAVSPSGEWTFTIVFLLSIIMAVIVYLGRPYASCICFIFPLCMESSAFEKSTNKCRLECFCANSFYDLMDSQNLVLWTAFSENHFDSISGLMWLSCIPWIHMLKPVPVDIVSDVFIFWVIGEFRVFQHHTPLTRTTPSEMIKFWVTYSIRR